MVLKLDTFQARQTLEQETFFQVKKLAEIGQSESAVGMLQRAGFSEETAQHLTQAIRRPELGGTIAFMLVRNQEVIDGRNLALIQDKQAA